jgi:fermentation-respiration switch protein FrsA (DUF1100 family)
LDSLPPLQSVKLVPAICPKADGIARTSDGGDRHGIDRLSPESPSLVPERNRPMPWLFAPLAVIALAYLLPMSALAVFQRRLLYRPIIDSVEPTAAGAPWMEVIREKGRLLGWYAPPPTNQAPVLVFFHGNQGTLARVARKTTPWRDQGLGLFAATYRGFEGNSGWPDEMGLYDDGRAVLDWLDRRGIPAERVIVYGESLGTGIAVQMAVERPVRAVVLEAPYTSIPDVAAYHYPWTPTRLFVLDRFDTLSKIGGVKAPLLILHGSADRTIPVSHSRRLATAAHGRAHFVEIAEAGHVDLFEHGASPPLAAFLAAIAIPERPEDLDKPCCHEGFPDR